MISSTLLGAVLATLTAGCAATAAAPPTGVPEPTSSRPITAEATTSAPATATVTAPPAAADGTDLAACADGTCEVLVTGPADIPLPAGSALASLRVEADGTVVARRPDGGGTSASGSGTLSGPGYRIEYARVDGGTLLRIAIG